MTKLHRKIGQFFFGGGFDFGFICKTILIFLLYLLTAKIGLSLDPISGFATYVWPPSGIALASMLVLGYEVFPAIFLGAYLVNLLLGAPELIALGIAGGNTLEAFASAYLLKNLSFRNSLERLQDSWNFVFFGAIVSTLIAATCGTTWLMIGHLAPEKMFGEIWTAWWIGDMLGILIVSPFILVWLDHQENQIKLIKALELLFVLLLFLSTCFVIYADLLGEYSRELPIGYLIFPILIWLTLRFRQREVISAIFLLSIIAIWGTTQGHGPFVRDDLAKSLFLLQIYLAVTTSTFLLFSSAIAEKNKLESRKNEFISIASHELKTPLTSLKGYVQIIQQIPHNKKLKTYSDRMNDQVIRINNLINQMLDSSRIGEDKLSIDYQFFDLTDLLKDIVEDNQKVITTHKIQFDPKTPLLIQADKSRIRQVVENLLNNAIKFSPEGKKVILELSSKKKFVIISVKDYGIGIDLKDQVDIFNRFFQAPNNKQGNVPGLGLGLYISAGIVKLHNGLIWVKSRKNKGAIFYLQLPLKPKK